ncbi:putative integral membrane protein [Deinobacterium chartae]|uniref:Putative integral membrane protein n=1 Tax=Deinobacterium chartae TaxID=521158 RepID=A0A841I6R1_9DEIO|nr:LapA family protein [Deinobacterium chartae]MBB6099929.1 putative integral membrane protein [Deinobacterium chartae]
MRFHNVLLLLVLALLVVFGIFNWNALSFPHTVNLLVVPAFQAPLGLILLVTAGLLAVVFSMLVSYNELRARAHEARYLKELDAVRQSLDAQEASRFHQLREHFDRVIAEVQARGAAAGSSQTAHDQELIEAFNARVDRVRDELAADIGQLEDAVLRRLGGTSAAPNPNKTQPL